jgi:lipopolysaccharide biosynthesis glycosyltransferase
VPQGSVPLAILDYQTPDHVLTSGNVGDYIQTLALIGNLVRFERVAVTGEGDLGALAGELRQQVRPEIRDGRVTGSVHLVPVDRDFSSASAVPEGTWMVAFGWHMHSLFDLRYDFPYHPNVRPIFLSFHVNRLDMLSPNALEYLRERGPIGCRDWTTVFLLLSAGVDAFFSGCLTTTVDAVFPSREAAFRGPGSVGVIDLPLRSAGPDARDARAYSHQSDDYRYMSLTGGVRAARDLLAAYQRDLRRAVTGRLHAYLPLTAIGVPVQFRTGGPGDVRFAGLTGFTPGDPRLGEMQDGIRDLVAGILEPILAGAGEADVYARWRELTAKGLAEARRRFEPPGADPDTAIDIGAAVASTRRASRRFGPHDAVDPAAVTDVVLAFDQNLTLPAAVLLESMLANASGPLRLSLLGRGLDDAYVQWLADAFPALPISYLPCDEITFGAAGRRPRRLPRRITVSTMDRLLLPDLLDGVARVVYLDVDTLMLGDVCALARTDLGGHPVAARDSNVSEASEWQRNGRNLAEPLALEVRRSMGRRHGYGHAALNAGVLVMDLDRLRRDGFTRQALGRVEAYGFHDQDAMLAYLGPERAVLDARWNAMPIFEDVEDPAVIHWASLGKPWDPQLTYAQDRWREYADRLRQHAGPPPAGAQAPSAPGTLGNPIEVGSPTAALPAEIERIVEAVLAEHLSYLGPVGLRDLAAAVEATEANGIEGLIVEAGTALGGSAITMAAAKSSARPMKLYDVFATIPAPAEQDGADAHRRYTMIASGRSKGIAGETYYGYRGDLVAHVTESFARHGLPLADNNIELVKGLFEDTLRLDEPVALAHLDGDWYASTMTCLTRLAPLVSVGGRLVIDDYDTWSGCRAAVDEYFAGRPGFRFERRGRLHVVRV